MYILIIKKEIKDNWLSIKTVRKYRLKSIAKVFKFYYEIKGYEVEVLEDDTI